MIGYDNNGNAVTFTGSDVRTFQAAALRSGLGLMAVGIKPHRSWKSLAHALSAASHYTGHLYKGKKDIERARADLKIFIQANKEHQS
jgi:hypothetical protein